MQPRHQQLHPNSHTEHRPRAGLPGTAGSKETSCTQLQHCTSAVWVEAHQEISRSKNRSVAEEPKTAPAGNPDYAHQEP